MNVLAIVPYLYNTSPGQRYRIEQWEPILKNLGVEITYAPFESAALNRLLYTEGNFAGKGKAILKSFIRRFSTAFEAREFDVVYIYREAALVGPAFFERLLKFLKVPIVYDFDDAIFLPNVSQANSKFGFLKSPGKVETICRIASQITVGNAFLADYAGQFNSQINIIPLTIDTAKYSLPANYEKNDVPVIVWSGSITTVEHLKTVGTTLQKLAQTEKFKLRVIGAVNFELDGVEIENVRWNAETEAIDLAVGDIGIMPLPSDNWSKGKCGMKALQYMGLGIPTICSDVGVNGEIIKDGDNGFLASNEAEWLLKLKELIHSAKRREEIGSAGRITVSDEYSAVIQAPRMFKVFDKAVTDKHDE